jgi:polyisoprenoid-binding protein YceI
MNKLLAAACGALLSFGANAAEYDFDKVHTQIFFKASHLGFSTSTGQFTEFDGNFVFDESDPTKSSVNVSIEVDSLDLSNHSEWHGHMMGEGFFDSANYPAMTFNSTSVKKTGEKTMDVMGDLTIKGVTKPVVLAVTFNKKGEAFGQKKAGFSATTTIDRTEFNVSAFAPAVGTEIPITIEVEGVEK